MPIPYVHETDVPYGVLEQKSPLIRRITANNSSHFTYWGTGTYIVGREGGPVAIIDPGPQDDSHIKATLDALGDIPVSHILVTHTHMDHSPACRAISEATGAETYAFGPHGSGREGGLEGEEVEAGADMDFTPDRPLASGEIIEGDGWTIEALHTPGHTSNHLCFALLDENILFTGDHIMGWSTTIVSPPDGDMAKYMDSTATIRARGFAALYPTHGPAITAPDAFIDALIRHREDREAKILAAVESGLSSVEAIVADVYTDVPVDIHPAAALSTLSHLIRLTDDGHIRVDGAATLEATYSVS